MYGADAKRAHEMEAHEVIVIEDHEPGTADTGRQMLRHFGEQQVFLINEDEPGAGCKKLRPADEQPSGRKDARAGATSNMSSDPLFRALRPVCIRQARPTQLEPFTDVLQIHSVSKFLAGRMQWGRAAEGMEAVGPPSDSKCDSVKG